MRFKTATEWFGSLKNPNSNMSTRVIVLIALSLVLFGAFVRLFPHLPNMTPVTAIAFAGGLYLGRRWALILPILILLVSDVFIGFYDWRIMASVYGSFALIGCLSFLARRYKNVLTVGLSVISASLLFFLITNAAVWLFSPWYEKSITGLLYSYELGIPFLRNMMVGDMLYSALLIGAFEAARAFAGRRARRMSLAVKGADAALHQSGTSA